jgi:hypothetical protein
MKAPKTITNSYHDFRILNVSKSTRHPQRRGRFMAIQEGSDPNDPQMRECTFVLTRGGTWMHCYLFLLLPGPLRRQAVFDTLRRARRYWPNYASGSKVWLARRADLRRQPNAHQEGVLQLEHALSDTASSRGYRNERVQGAAFVGSDGI